MRFDLDRLPSDPVLLQRMVRELVEALEERRRKTEQLEHELSRLLRDRYGRRSEKLDSAQLKLLLAELEAPAEAKPPAEAPAAPQPEPPPEASAPGKKKGHGRNKLPEALPREPREYLPAPELLTCSCGCALERFGEETSEQLDYKPACFRVRRHVRPKFACPKCQEGVVIAPMPAQPIEKGLGTAGLLAYVVVSKYADHLPLTRLEGIFARHGVEMSRKTMAGWIDTVASLLEPVVRGMLALVLASRKLHADDTPVPVLDKTRDRTREGRLWAFVGDEAHPYIVFAYSPNKKQDFIVRLLGGYKGYLQADAANGYDVLFTRKEIVEVACWAHARRKFYDALTTDEANSLIALAHIRLLYEIEEDARKLENDEERHELRQKKSKPILAKFKTWLDEEQPLVLPKSPTGQAIGYAQRQWSALNRYIEHGFLEIDNNAAERELRRIAVGRGNWLFCGSDAGGHSAAMLYSLVATCRHHGVEPWAYLTDVLERISTHPASRLADLFPDRWKALYANSSTERPPPAVNSTA